MPPAEAHTPIAMTHFGSAIWSKIRRSAGAIFCDTRPETIIRSAWRGDARKTSIPQRDRSYWPAPVAIISIAQHARPKVAGHIDCLRAQPIARSRVVSSTPRSTSSSISSGVVPSCTPSYRSTGMRGLLRGALLRERALARGDLLGLARRDVLMGPVEPALAPDIGVCGEHEPHEHSHLRQAEYPAPPERHRPREQEDRLDVEDDEQHRDDVELDAEPLAARQPDRVVAALVGRALDRVRVVRSQQRRGQDRGHREDRREPAHHQDREVLGQHGAILRAIVQAAFASRRARSSIRSWRSPSRPSDRLAIARRANDMIPRRGNSAFVARPMIAGLPIIDATQRPTMKKAPSVSSGTRGYCIVTAGRSVISASWTSSAAICPVSIA